MSRPAKSSRQPGREPTSSKRTNANALPAKALPAKALPRKSAGAGTSVGTAAPKKSAGGAKSVPLAPPAGAPANPVAISERPTHRWTFLTNHAHVLVLLKAEPELILREVANRVGITERAVQRIIQDLESAGFIRRQKVGRQNQYQVLTDQPLRHPIESHRTIGDLLRLIPG